MKTKYLLLFAILLSIPLVSSSPITLASLNVSFPDSWCNSGSHLISLEALDLNNNSIVVDNILFQIYPKNLSYETSITYLVNKTWYITGLNVYNTTNFTVIVSAFQNGYYISANKSYTVDNSCGNSLANKASNVDNFLSKNWIWIVLFIALLLFLIILVIVIKIAKR